MITSNDEVTEERFQSLLSRYQIWLDTSMKRINFTFDCVHLLYCECHKINFKPIRSYIDSPDRINYRKAAINSINKKDYKCFWYAATIALDYEKIGKHPERIAKIEPFLYKYN